MRDSVYSFHKQGNAYSSRIEKADRRISYENSTSLGPLRNCYENSQ